MRVSRDPADRGSDVAIPAPTADWRQLSGRNHDDARVARSWRCVAPICPRCAPSSISPPRPPSPRPPRSRWSPRRCTTPPRSTARIRRGPAVARFEADAAMLAEPALDVEVALVRALLRLIELLALQGTLYGQ